MKQRKPISRGLLIGLAVGLLILNAIVLTALTALCGDTEPYEGTAKATVCDLPGVVWGAFLVIPPLVVLTTGLGSQNARAAYAALASMVALTIAVFAVFAVVA